MTDEQRERLERFLDIDPRRGTSSVLVMTEDMQAALALIAELEQQVAALTKERDDTVLSGEALMEARAYLNEHLEPLGAKVNCAFFDDCIHNAVAFALIQKEAREAAESALARAMPVVKAAVAIDQHVLDGDLIGISGSVVTRFHDAVAAYRAAEKEASDER